MHEDPPAPKEEQLPGHTEVILSEFKRRVEDVKHLDSTDPDMVSMTLHKGLERLEANDMLQKYEAGVVPTIESITKAAQEASAALLEDPDDAEAAKLAKLLEGSVSSIRSWSRRYVASLLKFHAAKSQFLRMSEMEQRDTLVDADKDRRRIHDALLNSLSVFNQQLFDAQGITTFASATEWVPGKDFPSGTADSAPMVFSKAAIADRNLIRDWAIAADLGEEIKKVLRNLSPKD